MKLTELTDWFIAVGYNQFTESKAMADPQFSSLEESLKKNLPEDDRKEVMRILYGRELP